MRKFMKLLIALLAFCGVFLGIATYTGAFLKDDTLALENRFTPGRVTSTVEEDFDGSLKEHVYIRNTGNIDAYIRVAILPLWINEAGNISEDPVTATDFSPFVPMTGWFRGTDGYYYHEEIVPPGELTSMLIDSFLMPVKEDLRFELQIIASAIQADPPHAVAEAWPLVSVGVDGKLVGGGAP